MEIVLVAVLLVLFTLVKLWGFEQEKSRRLEKAEKVLRARASASSTGAGPRSGSDEGEEASADRKVPAEEESA